MNIIQKFILYSLLHSCSFLLYGQPDNLSHEDFIIVFDNEEEDIYPIEDNDTICLIQDFQDDVNSNLNVEVKSIEELNKNILDNVDVNVLPIAPEDIVILDHGVHKESDDAIACKCDDNQELTGSISNPSFIEPCIENMSIDQIEESLNSLLGMHDEEIIIDESCSNDCIIIPIDITETTTPIDNGPIVNENCINLSKIEVESVVTDDDIVPVPHDLINSVKKTTKKKKKLEKARLKEAKRKKNKS